MISSEHEKRHPGLQDACEMKDRSDSIGASFLPLLEVCSAVAPGDSEPDDCSAELQVDDRCAVRAPPDGCSEVAALDGYSAAADSASADYSQQAGCSELVAVPDDCSAAAGSLAGCFQRADYSELAAARDDCSAVPPQDDHSAPAVQLDDSPEQADSAVDGSAVDSQRARHQDGCPADSPEA